MYSLVCFLSIYYENESPEHTHGHILAGSTFRCNRALILVGIGLGTGSLDEMRKEHRIGSCCDRRWYN